MQTVTRQPSKRSKKPPVIKEAKTVGSKKKATAKPVVDVPKNSGADQAIAAFVKANKPSVKSYLENEFEGVTATLVNSVTKECAECSILKRSPKKSKLWTPDIIEEVLKNACKPVKAAAKKAAPQPLKKKAKAPAKKAKTAAKPATKKKTVKKAAKKAASTKKVTKKKVAKKAASKKATKKVVKKASKASTLTVSVDEIKKMKGVKQWEAVALNLKHQKKIWIQAQDIPAVMGALYKVHTGKAKLPEEGLPGKGEKSYGKRRCVKMLTQVKETIASL